MNRKVKLNLGTEHQTDFVPFDRHVQTAHVEELQGYETHTLKLVYEGSLNLENKSPTNITLPLPLP